MSEAGTNSINYIYGSIFRDASIGMSVVDEHGVIVEANHAFCRMVGCEKKDVVGAEPPYPFFTVSKEGEKKPAGRGFFEGVKYDAPVYFEREGGIEYPVRVTSQPLHNGEEGFSGHVAFMFDLSDWDELDTNPAEKAHFLKAMLINTGEIIYVKDTEGRYTWLTDAFANLCDRSREELIGKTVFDVFPRRIAEPLAQMDERILEGHPVRSFDTVPLGRNHDIFNILKFPLIDEEGNTTRLCGIVRMVTQQRRMEKVLLRSQRADAMLGLAANIAHDFNNIIMGISGYVTMALQSCHENDPAYSDLQEVDRALEQAGDYTKRLLSLGSSMPSRVRKGSMKEVIRNVVLLLERTFPRNIDIEVSRPEEDRPVLINKGQLERALINICVNARDAMEEGGRLAVNMDYLSLTGLDTGDHMDIPSGDYCRVILSDTGEGMSDEVAERAFEPFFTTRSCGEAAGLGLSIAYGIIKEHGGGLKIDSRVGKGTTVEVLIPVAGE